MDANLVVFETSTIHQAIEKISANGLQMVFVIDENSKFLGTVSDGDIRRGLLKGYSLSTSVLNVTKLDSFYLFESEIYQLGSLNIPVGVRKIPILSDKREVIGVLDSNEVDTFIFANVPVVIMAGGRGERLRPITENTPKPMLKIGEQSLLEKLILDLKGQGFEKFFISVHYLADQIKDHFKDGSNFGVEITYLTEEYPRGTAGALSLLPKNLSNSVLMLNSDLVTNINYQSLLKFHDTGQFKLTVCSRSYEIQIPYGVLELDGEFLQQLTEKPVFQFQVNAGIYVLNSTVIDYVPTSGSYDITELINNLIENKLSIGAFPMFESWQDIGRPSDLDKVRNQTV
jgi:dTDP-glucose pyrophosphorylase